MASDQDHDKVGLTRTYTAALLDGGSAMLERIKSLNAGGQSDDPFEDDGDTRYSGDDITSWRVIFKINRTVWKRRSLWFACFKLSVLTWVTGITTVLLVEDPSRLHLGSLTKLSTLLNVFVSLMVGFFISSSIRRWYAAADGFMELFDAARSLQMDLFALGVDDKTIDAIMRYACLSGWLLNMELAIEASEPDKKAGLTERMWRILKTDKEKGAVFGMEGLLTDEEQIALEPTCDPAATIWMWITMIIGHMAAAGDVPPMQSPTYGRLQSSTHEAHTGIRKVRCAISIQAPFVYVQMLASLVHMHNIFNSIAFGLTAGSAICMLQIREGSSVHDVSRRVVTRDEIMNDMQNLLVCFFLSVVGPLIYQGLLEVCVAVAQPFSSKDGAVPTTNLLNVLHDDLKSAKLLKSDMPKGWSQAHFKTPV